MARVLIAGGPRVGKSTLAEQLAEKTGNAVGHICGSGCKATTHTDDMIPTHSWSEVSEQIAKKMDEPDYGIIEGVAVARGIRKWLASHPEGKPADQVIVMRTPQVPLSPGQARMAKGCETVWKEVEPELIRRGVHIRKI